ncbi:MAG TPA: VWA domain-containing protein, partial [Rhodospirillales bacterium]|nr:VWA domain-containing protein [Rhodospirillales bacterium]
VPWSSKVNVTIDGQAFNAGLTTTAGVSAYTVPDIGGSQSRVFYANNSPVPLLQAPPAGWKGCVFDRYVHNGTDDDDGDIRDGTFSGGGKSWPAWAPVLTLPANHSDTALALARGGEPVSGNNEHDPAQRCAQAPSGQECTACPTIGITPMQHDKAVINTAIDRLRSGGNTNLPAGLGWAWRVLTSIPPFEHTPSVEYEPLKAIVLMTDGENCASYGDGYKAVFGVCSNNAARNAMNARAIKLANTVKASGVIIYVVQFVERNAALETFLKTVASGPTSPYYYYAPDAGALSAAFHEIANNLSELRLSK